MAQLAQKGYNTLKNKVISGGQAIAGNAPAAGRILKAVGEKTYGVTITPEEKTAQMMQGYQASGGTFAERVKGLVTGTEAAGKPITEANTAARLGMVGSEWDLGVQGKQLSTKLWKDVIQPKLAAIKEPVNLKTFFGEVEKNISKVSDLTRRNILKEGLEAIKEDYKNVGKISLEKLQNYKEGWAEFIPEATYKGKPIAGAIKAVKDLMASKARSIIYKYVGEEGRQAYIDYGNLQSIMKAGIKSAIVDPAKQSITRDIWRFIMDKAVTPAATLFGKVLYRTGEGLEFVGNPGAKTVGDIIQMPTIPPLLAPRKQQ
jgi:hypothetical protein